MFYKNTSYSVKTFYGVTFRPNETKEVPGYINDKYMIVADAPVTISTKSQQKPSPEKPKKEAEKSAEVKKEAEKPAQA